MSLRRGQDDTPDFDPTYEEPNEPEYPEAEKWTGWYDGFVSISGFMEWLSYEKGMQLAQHIKQECYKLYPITERLINLYYEYAGIDGDKLEAERRAMLDNMREMNMKDEV